MTPQQVRTAYGINSIALGSVAGDGSSQTIAIIDAFDAPNLVDSTDPNFVNSDLHQFDLQFSLPDPPSFVKVNETGGASLPAASGSSGWSVEASLDVEWAHAIAPRANIVLFEANSTADSDLITTAVNTARNWPGVVAISMSFGRAESSNDTSELSVFNTPSGHPGVTFLASTGDSGAPGGFPADAPNVVAVGGTTLNINPSTYAYVSETGWSEGGGGQSTYEAEPSYQTAVNTSGWRQIPDVSFDADPSTGVAVLDTYDFGNSTPWVQVGGTSVSSPCWAGLVAVGGQLRSAVGLATTDGSTQTLPQLYSMKAADFHDIINGNNGNAAHLGYDMVTGIGSPVADKLVPDFILVTSHGTAAFSAPTYEVGTPVTVTIGDLDLAASPSCTVTLTSSTGDSETLSVPALGGGVFQVSIPTSDGTVAAGDGVLETVPGGTITLTYNDSNDGTGNSATVTAQATMFRVDHFAFNAISGSEQDGVPFAVTVSAYDSSGDLISGYDGTVTLTASGSGGPISVSPTLMTFVSGVWTGNIRVNGVDSAVTLGVNSSRGAVGISNTFALQPGPVANLQWCTILSPQVQGVPFPVTLTAKDANGYTVTNYTGTVSLSAQNAQGAIPVTPATSGSFVSGVWTGSATVLRGANGVYLVASAGTGISGNSNTFSVSAVPTPDLTVSMTHSGTFKQGDVGDTYTITVTNSGTLPTSAAVNLADLLPAGFTATAFAGTGWTTNLATLTATRSDALAAGTSYPVLTLTVNVAVNAAASLTNTATVSGGGEIDPSNDTASDVTAITQVPDLTVAVTHLGNFHLGDVGDTYTITVTNTGWGATSGAVTVLDSLPAGLTATAFSGAGWTVNLSTLTATRSDALAAQASYPVLKLTVNVAYNMPASFTNTASVTGGGETNTANDTANDVTVIGVAPTVFPLTSNINGGTVEAGTQMLVLGFDEVVSGAGTAANYELRAAGADGLLGTADDRIVPLTVCYQGAEATLSFPPLAEDTYRLTVHDAIVDASGRKLDGNGDGVAGGDWVRDFVVTSSSTLFGGPLNFASGGVQPSSVATGDFNGDGIPDLVVANSGGDTNQGNIAVLLGDGTGKFGAPMPVSVGMTSPTSLAVGDMNHDGKSDVVVADSGNGNLYLLLGNGRGGFTSTTLFSCGGVSNGPSAVAIADFNGDGNNDVVVANGKSNTIGVMFGDGKGGLGAVHTYATGGNYAYNLAIGDFNGDGKPDIAVVNCNDCTLSVLLNNGSGGFSGGVIYTYSAGMYSVAVGDFNGDGKSDLAVGLITYVGILLGNGNGGFGSASTYTVRSSSNAAFGHVSSIVATDLNNDGKSDLVVGGSSTCVLMNNGNATFTAATTFSAGAGGSVLATADFNADGRMDVVAVSTQDNSVGILLGIGDGSFAAIQPLSTVGGSQNDLASADFNGDGQPDLVVAGYSTNGVSLLLGQGQAGFAPAVTFPTGGKGYYAAVGDFNGDGKEDLVVTNYTPSGTGTASVLLGDGKGGFAAPIVFSTGGIDPTRVYVADFNNDGKSDLAIVNAVSDNVTVFLGNGNGTFTLSTTISTGTTYARSVAIGDFNRDGKADLVMSFGSSSLALFLGNGAGGFTAAGTLSVGVATEALLVHDFNGDGNPDLLAVDRTGLDLATMRIGYAYILLGDGKGGFASPVKIYVGAICPNAVTVGDFNRDGNTDLAFSTDYGGVVVMLGTGPTTFAAPLFFSAGSWASCDILSGDFTGDGQLDLVVGNTKTDGITLLPNICGPAPIALTSQDGTNFDVATGNSGAGQLVAGTNNAFDGDGRLLVGGKLYSPTLLTPTLGDGGCTVITGAGNVAGLSVSRKVTVPNSGAQDFARTVDTFTNSSGSPVTTTVTIIGNLGSGANTTVFATSDGTGVASPNDQWIGTDDADLSGAPAVIHYIHGPAGLTPSSVVVTGGNIIWTYNLTVPAWQSVNLAYFTIVSPSQAGAIAAANALVTSSGFGGQAATFLSSTDLASLGNFLFPPVAAVTLNTHSPQTNDVLTATVSDFDPGGNPVTLTYVWTVNGKVKRTFTSATALSDSFNLSVSGNGDKGDVVAVSVTPNDGYLNGAVATDSATVADTAPTATVSLNNHTPRTNDVLTAMAVPSDVDGDVVQLTYVWKVGGAVKQTDTTTALSDTFNLDLPGNGDAGDVVTVEVTPYDNTLYGMTATDTATVVSSIRTWDGGGTDNNWTTAGNWADGVVPVAGDALVFANSARISPYNNFPDGTVFDSITFANGGFTLSGDHVKLTPAAGVAINNVAGQNGIDLPIASSSTGTVVVQGGALRLGLNAQGIVLSGGGSDIQTGKLVFDYTGGSTPAATILALLTASYDGGAWDVGRFRSSKAIANGTTLGWEDYVTSSQVTVMATIPGDFNLDGTVDSNDLAICYANVWTGTTWSQGDANYDGTVNGLDRDILMANFSRSVSGSPSPSPLPSPSDSGGASPSLGSSMNGGENTAGQRSGGAGSQSKPTSTLRPASPSNFLATNTGWKAARAAVFSGLAAVPGSLLDGVL
jgi:uncharacterized repeat protein (TIGR01451 family)